MDLQGLLKEIAIIPARERFSRRDGLERLRNIGRLRVIWRWYKESQGMIVSLVMRKRLNKVRKWEEAFWQLRIFWAGVGEIGQEDGYEGRLEVLKRAKTCSHRAKSRQFIN